ncbi:MAG: hypothetical protein IKK39_02090, partial [Thermoguttaceae bacterium]|nr:hypothetical protein [Thermoguttaceae bacterium]
MPAELDFDAKIQRFAELLAASPKIAALTGAGISTESGIPDFRSSTGIYQRRRKRSSPSIFSTRIRASFTGFSGRFTRKRSLRRRTPGTSRSPTWNASSANASKSLRKTSTRSTRPPVRRTFGRFTGRCERRVASFASGRSSLPSSARPSRRARFRAVPNAAAF